MCLYNVYVEGSCCYFSAVSIRNCMAQVLIKSDDSPLKEWMLIELQGELKTRFGDEFPGKNIGDLHFDKKGEPILIVGHHVIFGKKVKLDKPFIVLKKCDPEEDGNYVSKHTVKAKVVAKLLFKSRPKPIILHVPKKVV